MPAHESVSSSLIGLSDLQNDVIVAVDAWVDGVPVPLIVYRNGQAVRAWHNACPHAGRRLEYAPEKFLRDPTHLICAVHGATFRLQDGQCIAGPCRGDRLGSVPVTIGEEGVITFGELRPSATTSTDSP